MFKRGGPSYQSQGTGITSPFDTPRKQYQFGTSFEEIQENIRKSTADNTTTMQDVAQGYSYLASPYKEDGSAKTIGEMIFDGSQAVSASRGDRQKTAQAGELAAQEVGVEKIKSDIAVSEAAKDRKSKEKIAALTPDELKRTPLDRLILDTQNTILKTAVPGSFEYQNASGLAKGRAIAAKMAADGITVGVIEDWVKTKDGWDYNADNMRSDMPWFDPTTNQWVVFNDNGSGYITGDPVKSFLTAEEAVAYLKGGNQEIIKDTETLEETNEEEGAGLKEIIEKERKNKLSKKKGKTYQEMQEDTVQVSDIVDKVTDPETWAGTIGGDSRGYGNRGSNTYVTKKADGGRIGYMDGSDPEATELDMLNNWWRKQLATNFNE